MTRIISMFCMVLCICSIKCYAADQYYSITTDTTAYYIRAGNGETNLIATMSYKIENCCNDTLWLWFDKEDPKLDKTDTRTRISRYLRNNHNNGDNYSILMTIAHCDVVFPIIPLLYSNFITEIYPGHSFTIYRQKIFSSFDKLDECIGLDISMNKWNECIGLDFRMPEFFCMPEKEIIDHYCMAKYIKYDPMYGGIFFYKHDSIVWPPDGDMISGVQPCGQ